MRTVYKEKTYETVVIELHVLNSSNTLTKYIKYTDNSLCFNHNFSPVTTVRYNTVEQNINIFNCNIEIKFKLCTISIKYM